MTTTTAATAMTLRSKQYIRRAKTPNRLAQIALWYLETICEGLGHPGACVLFNSFRVGRFGTWWHSTVVRRLFEAAGSFTPWEPTG